jgi:hypothetical protein
MTDAGEGRMEENGDNGGRVQEERASWTKYIFLARSRRGQVLNRIHFWLPQIWVLSSFAKQEAFKRKKLASCRHGVVGQASVSLVPLPKYCLPFSVILLSNIRSLFPPCQNMQVI